MDDELDDRLGFAPDDDSPIPYMQRTRDYYRGDRLHHAISLGALCRRAVRRADQAAAPGAGRHCHHRRAVPAGQGRPGAGRGVQRRRQVLCGVFRRYLGRRTTCASRTSATTASTPRRPTAAPGFRCPRCCGRWHAGRIGALTPRFHGAPTNRSHRVTIETDAPEILRRCREDGADAAILVPNCPVCHQTCSLVARHLEANGIPTVVMGCAKDIVEHAGVARFLFSDFPLGNSAGRPHDVASQAQTLELALRAAGIGGGAAHDHAVAAALGGERRRGSWTTCNLDRIPPDELARRRAEFDRQKELARPNRVEKAA